MEQKNPKNKYHVAVFQTESVVEHLLMRVIGKFAKLIKCFYVDLLHFCQASVTEKPVNEGAKAYFSAFGSS